MTLPKKSLTLLRKLRMQYGPNDASKKAELLRALHARALASAKDVGSFHDMLCFMRAYPDNANIARVVNEELNRFHRRGDFKRFRKQLDDSGIAGTRIHYHFYWQTALWIYLHWPESLLIDWNCWENESALDDIWPLLAPDPVVEALETTSMTSQDLIQRLKKNETDGAYLVRSFLRLDVNEPVREKLFEDLAIPFILEPQTGSPSYTHSRIRPLRAVYGLPEFSSVGLDKRILKENPTAMESVSPSKGNRLVDLARTQMVTHARDLYAFMHADPMDVRIIHYSGGLDFVAYGLRPSKRNLLEGMYVFLILRNGVPIGYTQAVSLLRSSEVNFTLFDIYRGVEAARIYNYSLAMIRWFLRSDAFVVNTQQLGEGNEDAIESGAFWFYHKLGFRPKEPRIRVLAEREVRKKTRDPAYRSHRGILEQLGSCEMRLFLKGERSQLVSTLPVEVLGLSAGERMERQARDSDPFAVASCVRECARLLGRRPSSSEPAVRRAWERWAPLALCLPGIERWTQANRLALARIIDAKGGRRESDYVLLFDKHQSLRSALAKLA